ncbi:MAG: sulfite exporter TauE/SafE family protein [Verrucomicrobiota bacterium]|jgi:sulfite exporter TauE/SafE
MNLLAAFFLGLAGSLHCAVMCGPLLVAVNAARRQNPAHSAAPCRAGILHNFAYHGGRLVTYSFLGAVSGLVGAAIVFAGFQRWLSIGAGCLILLASLTSFRAQWGGLAGKVVSAAKTRFGRLLRNRTLGAAILLGGLNGMLPCGLVYIACAAAAAAGSVTGGVATMLAFGLGTAPMLLSIGLAGRAVRWTNPLRLRRVVLVCATVAGVLLIVRGLSLGIPYLSPHFSDGHAPACDCHHTL